VCVGIVGVVILVSGFGFLAYHLECPSEPNGSRADVSLHKDQLVHVDAGLQRIMLRTTIVTPTKTKKPPILILYLKNGLLLLTTPIALNMRNKPITINAKPSTGKKPVIIGI
jgi:hypothetical protein